MDRTTIYLSLGSNLGNSLEYLLAALLELEKNEVVIDAVSGIYLSEPIGYIEQPEFFNLVVRAQTILEPFDLLHLCQDIEHKLGRKKSAHWGPREIDIDILYYGNREITTKELTVPHPRIGERAFVLMPLKEISPSLFEKLDIDMPKQNICLKIEQSDVRIMLKKRKPTCDL